MEIKPKKLIEILEEVGDSKFDLWTNKLVKVYRKTHGRAVSSRVGTDFDWNSYAKRIDYLRRGINRCYRKHKEISSEELALY